ncbi:MAG: response regulator, partial [Deltaproteobacteria bacterium]|nr:response regulator [Deltaproteobacteria bacterium]
MKDNPPRLILIADRDKEAAMQLGDALRKKGYGVVYTYDGSNSIEVVITHLPDLIFYDAALPLIHYKKFIQIVRSNPRTMHIPIIIVGRSTDRIGFATLTESKINKPYDINAVVKMVENIFHKIDTADMLKSSTKAFEGKLSEISLPDLMQVFAL